MHFRTFLFDLDGTLIDHFEAIHRCHTETMQHFGLPAPTLQDVRNVIGGGLEEAVAKFFGPHHPDLVPAAVQFYRSVWPKHILVGVKLLPGAIELLKTLKARGAVSAVFTNKHGPSARQVCEYLGITPLVQGVFGALDTPWLKPQREFTDYALKALGAEAATTLLVGDSPWDVAAARNSSFPCWAVSTGTHNGKELEAAGAARVFASLGEIQQALPA